MVIIIILIFTNLIVKKQDITQFLRLFSFRITNIFIMILRIVSFVHICIGEITFFHLLIYNKFLHCHY